MRRRSRYILLPVLGTTVIHAVAAVSFWMIGIYQSASRPDWHPAPQSAPESSPVYVDEPEVQPEPPPPPPDLDSVFGESDGTGDAVNSLEGDLPQSGPRGFQNQAPTSPDAGLSLPPQVEQQAQRPPTGGFKVPTLPGRTPTLPEPNDIEGEAPDEAPAERPVEQPEEMAVGEQQEATEATPPTDGAKSPKSPDESEMSAASTVRSATFTNGKVDARFGREYILGNWRPFLTTREEVAFNRFPLVIQMVLTLDDDGNVLDVQFARRSPSPALDRAMELAMYSSWFEPVPGEPTVKVTFVWTG